MIANYQYKCRYCKEIETIVIKVNDINHAEDLISYTTAHGIKNMTIHECVEDLQIGVCDLIGFYITEN